VTVCTQRGRCLFGRRRRVWQRNYYEYIIRDDDELNRIRQYIEENPLRWHLDREKPEAAVAIPGEPWEV